MKYFKVTDLTNTQIYVKYRIRSQSLSSTLSLELHDNFWTFDHTEKDTSILKQTSLVYFNDQVYIFVFLYFEK